MADLGSIGRQASFLAGAARILPTWEVSYQTTPDYSAAGALGTDTTGTISGTVKNGGVALPFAKVVLYYRPNNQLISRRVASDAGAYSFNGLRVGVADYYAIAIDPDNLTFNSLIFDRLAPV